MPDFSAEGLLQQFQAQPKSGEYLELLGKQAAAQWHRGQHENLSAAVVANVKEAHLSPEQVRRVIEFTNTAAFLDEFQKEGSVHKVIEFEGGPADPGTIFQDLNDGGGGSIRDAGLGDYRYAPEPSKTASAEEEQFFKLAFGAEPEPLPYADPLSEAVHLYEKLGGAAENIHSQLSGLEVLYADLGDRLYEQVKQAALEGGTLGQVLSAWQEVSPSDDHVKAAFSLVSPRLLENEVFSTVEEMTGSLDKTASGVLNREHPLVTDFIDFCDSLTKMAEMREAYKELVVNQDQLGVFLKKASVVGQVTGAARATAKAVRPLADSVVGPRAGALVEKGVQYAPHLALVVGANEANTHLNNSPSIPARTYRRAKNVLLQQIPGTDAQIQHLQSIQYGYPNG